MVHQTELIIDFAQPPCFTFYKNTTLK